MPADKDSHTTSTNADSFRRVEVITGVGRRRRWSLEDKARIVAESLDPATTSSAVARRYGLHASQLLVARIRPGAGILKTLLLRRIGSSLRAGLLTARTLRAGEERMLLGEEEESVTREGVADIGGEALQKLDSAIALMEAAGDDDPKLRVVLDRLRRDGWAARGCILFSQYLDTVLWLAGHLAQAFPATPVAIYGGQGSSFLLEGDRRRGASREEIQSLVRDRSLRLLVATDAASEGLNLQRLETLVNVDLPWNPARLEQRKGQIDRIGQLAAAIDVLNLRYRGSVEDEVHRALSSIAAVLDNPCADDRASGASVQLNCRLLCRQELA